MFSLADYERPAEMIFSRKKVKSFIKGKSWETENGWYQVEGTPRGQVSTKVKKEPMKKEPDSGLGSLTGQVKRQFPDTSTPITAPLPTAAGRPQPVFAEVDSVDQPNETIPWETMSSKADSTEVQAKASHHHHIADVALPCHHHLHFQPHAHYHLPAPHACNPFAGICPGTACSGLSTAPPTLSWPHRGYKEDCMPGSNQVFSCSNPAPPAKKKPRRSSESDKADYCYYMHRDNFRGQHERDHSSSDDESNLRRRVTRSQLLRSRRYFN